MINIFVLAILNFLCSFLIAKPVINALKKLKSIQSFRELGPQSHITTKAGTPTMGGVIFLIPILLSSIYLISISQSKALLLVSIALFAGAAMGAVDDGVKILQSSYKGISSKQKLIIQFCISSIIVIFSGRYLFPGFDLLPSTIVPTILEFAWAFIVIAGTSNAINLSDGLDGLATMLSIIAFGALGYLLWNFGDNFTVYLCVAVIFALTGFLVFNFKPAKVFMGDTGSLALGMGLGALAYVTNTEWYLLIFALVPVLETLSVMLQVSSAILSRKYLGKDIRIFKMAPLHHHFELCGFPELTVVLSFTLFGLAMVIAFFIMKPPLPFLIW